jgi:hypothetical protein
MGNIHVLYDGRVIKEGLAESLQAKFGVSKSW